MVRDGRSGLLVDGHEPRDWAAAMRRVLEDGDLRSRLAVGRGRAGSEFSWDHTAQHTLEVYRRARSSLLDAVS